MAAGPHFEATFKSTAAQSFQTSLEDVKTNQNMRLKTSNCCRRRHILAPWMFVALLSAPKVVWGILLSRKWLLLSQGKAASLILKQVKGAPWWRKCKTPRELRHSLGVSEREAKWNETIQISFGATLFFFFFQEWFKFTCGWNCHDRDCFKVTCWWDGWGVTSQISTRGFASTVNNWGWGWGGHFLMNCSPREWFMVTMTHLKSPVDNIVAWVIDLGRRVDLSSHMSHWFGVTSS